MSHFPCLPHHPKPRLVSPQFSSDATDEHWIDRVRISAPLLSTHHASVPFSFTLNRNHHIETGVNYTYAPPPVVSSVSPAGGPRGGGTAVTLTGVHLPAGEHSRCSFGGEAIGEGELKLALAPHQSAAHSLHVADDGVSSVVCITPSASAVAGEEDDRTVRVSLAINGADFETTAPVPANFTRFAPIVSVVYPASGPSAGGFQVTF